MRRVVAGVQHRHGGADPVVAGRPCLRRVDLGDRVLQGHLDAAVEVDTGGAVVQGGRVAGGVLTPGEVGPERPAGRLVGVERRDAEPWQGDGALGAVQRGAPRLLRGLRALAVVHHHRQRPARGVVVLRLDQRGDVEEVVVEPVRLEQAQRLARHDVDVVVDLLDGRLRDGPVRSRLQRDGLSSVGRRRDLDDVAGHQRDRLHRRGPTRFGAAAGADGEAAAEPGADTRPTETAATARTTVVRTVRRADRGMQESFRRGSPGGGQPGEPEVGRLTDL